MELKTLFDQTQADENNGQIVKIFICFNNNVYFKIIIEINNDVLLLYWVTVI